MLDKAARIAQAAEFMARARRLEAEVAEGGPTSQAGSGSALTRGRWSNAAILSLTSFSALDYRTDAACAGRSEGRPPTPP